MLSRNFYFKHTAGMKRSLVIYPTVVPSEQSAYTLRSSDSNPVIFVLIGRWFVEAFTCTFYGQENRNDMPYLKSTSEKIHLKTQLLYVFNCTFCRNKIYIPFNIKNGQLHACLSCCKSLTIIAQTIYLKSLG